MVSVKYVLHKYSTLLSIDCITDQRLGSLLAIGVARYLSVARPLDGVTKSYLLLCCYESHRIVTKSTRSDVPVLGTFRNCPNFYLGAILIKRFNSRYVSPCLCGEFVPMPQKNFHTSDRS